MNAYPLRKEFFCIAWMVSFAILWFWAIETVFPRYFLWNDNATFFLPLTLFNFETLRSEHVLPIINFFQFAGWNHLHAGQSGVLYPPAYAAAWIASALLQSPLLTIDILCIGHLTAGMLGMYAWLRLLGAKRGFAAGGALLYLTLPFSTLLTSAWAIVSGAHCFVPVCFALLESNLQSRTTLKTTGYILAKALFMLQGYPQFVVYCGLFEVLYIAMRGRAPWRTWVGFFGANATALVLCLPILLPIAEATLLSAYRHVPFSLMQTIDKHLSVSDFLLNQIIPYQRYYYGDINLFLLGGSIFLPWIVYKTISARRHAPEIIARLSIICVIALLLSTPLYATISWLPLMNHFRWPFKLFFFVGLFFVPAIVLLLQWLHKEHLLPMKQIIFIAIFALVSHAAVLPSAIAEKHPLTKMYSPLNEFSQDDFRMIGVSTPDIKRQPSLYEDLPSFNYPSIWRIPVLTGYDPLISSSHADISTRLTDLSGIYEPSYLPSIMDHLSRWSVRYVASRETLPEELLEQTSLRRIPADSSMIVYENAEAFPVAAFEASPMESIPVEYKANRIRITTANVTGTLFVRVAPLQGYRKVNPDGLQEPANLTQSGIILLVKEPQEFVDLVYRSPSFERGLVGTLIAALLMGIGMIAAGIRFLFHKAAHKRTDANRHSAFFGQRNT